MYRRHRAKSSAYGHKTAMAQAHLRVRPSRKSRRLHALGTDDTRRLGRPKEAAKGASGRTVRCRRGKTGRVENEVSHFAGQRADEMGPFDRLVFDDLLHAELGLAAGDDLAHRPADGKHGL